MSYDEGSLVRISTSPPFQNLSGVNTDPTDVYLEWQILPQSGVWSATTTWHFQPPSTSVTGSIVRDSTGTFHADLDTTGQPGLWTYRWRGEGAIQAVFDGSFYVDASPLP